MNAVHKLAENLESQTQHNSLDSLIISKVFDDRYDLELKLANLVYPIHKYDQISLIMLFKK